MRVGAVCHLQQSAVNEHPSRQRQVQERHCHDSSVPVSVLLLVWTLYVIFAQGAD